MTEEQLKEWQEDTYEMKRQCVSFETEDESLQWKKKQKEKEEKRKKESEKLKEQLIGEIERVLCTGT